MTVNNKKILFIGSGNMAQAIISGMLCKKLINPENIICNDVLEETLNTVKNKYGVSIVNEKKDAVAGADIIFLAVKPQNMQDVLRDISAFVKPETFVISIAAGISTSFIENILGGSTPAVRAMPNLLSAVGEGVTALCGGKYASKDNLKIAADIFLAVGTAYEVTEDKFDAVTALSGSGPAYVFYLCELMQQAGEKLGLDKEIAKIFALQTLYGSGKMLVQTGVDAAVLRQKVTSPGGTTAAAIKCFEDNKFYDIVLNAMKKASDRSKELSK